MAKNGKQLTQGKKILITVVSFLLLPIIVSFLRDRIGGDLPTVKIPVHPVPHPNAYEYYLHAAGRIRNNHFYTRLPNLTFALLSPVQQQVVLENNAEALKLFRQGLAYECQAIPDNTPKRFTGIFEESNPFGSLGCLRDIARLVVFEAYVKASRGDVSGAVNSRLEVLHMGIDLGHDSQILPYLAGADFQRMARGYNNFYIWDAVGRLDAPAARKASRQMEKLLGAQMSFAETLRNQKYCDEAYLVDMMSKPGWRTELIKDPSDFQTKLDLVFTSRSSAIHEYAAYTDMAINRAELPYAIQKSMAPLPTVKAPASFITWPLPKLLFKNTVNNTINILLALQLALQAYHQEHGAYPVSLSELAPGYLTKIPADPFAKQGPPQYRRKGESYILYSLGPDCTDDGGKSINGSSKKMVYLDSETRGDIVAGVDKY